MGEIFSSFGNIMKAIAGFFQWLMNGLFGSGFQNGPGLMETIAGNIMAPRIESELRGQSANLERLAGAPLQDANYQALTATVVPVLRGYAADTERLRGMGDGAYQQISTELFNELRRPENLARINQGGVNFSEASLRVIADNMSESFVRNRLGDQAPALPQSFRQSRDTNMGTVVIASIAPAANTVMENLVGPQIAAGVRDIGSNLLNSLSPSPTPTPSPTVSPGATPPAPATTNTPAAPRQINRERLNTTLSTVINGYLSRNGMQGADLARYTTEVTRVASDTIMNSPASQQLLLEGRYNHLAPLIAQQILQDPTTGPAVRSRAPFFATENMIFHRLTTDIGTSLSDFRNDNRSFNDNVIAAASSSLVPGEQGGPNINPLLGANTRSEQRRV